MTFSRLDKDLQALQQQGLLRRRRVVENPQGTHLRVDGRDCLSFCSNDYLGLANHPALVEAARAGAGDYGVGAGASHLIAGHSTAHQRLERELAEFVGLPQALLFSTGYMANLGVVSALLGRNDAVFADKLNHASLNDAALLSRARLMRYGHGDLGQLERMLAGARHRRKLVATDAVFSMDGDLAPVAPLLALCERYDAHLLLDDAHGFGLLGERGSGVLEHFALSSPRIIYMATLGKAAGVFGAFVAGPERLIQTLIQRARSYIYTTAFPPLLAVALLASLKLIREETWRRTHVRQLIDHLRGSLRPAHWELMPSHTPIQPLLVGTNRDALALAEALLQRGILAPAIRPPTVPAGQARLRISLSAAHRTEDVARLVRALHELEPTLPPRAP